MTHPLRLDNYRLLGRSGLRVPAAGGRLGIVVCLPRGCKPMNPRHAIPPESAKSHANGFSCKTPEAYVYDANGHRRWCIDCRAELGEVEWLEGGHDVPDWAIGAAFAVLGLVLLLVCLMLALASPPANDGAPGGTLAPSRATPSPYGPPDPEWAIDRASGVMSNSVPMIQ